MAKEEKTKLKEGNISLILDGYDDLFSDFDPRPYSEKALSDDFLSECKKAAKEKLIEEEIKLRLLVPKNKRDYKNEKIIKTRLKTIFLKQFHKQQKEIKKIKLEGMLWFLLGSGIMTLATFLLKYQAKFFFKFLIIMAEPAGWFTFWEGLGKIFIDSKTKKPDHDFYHKMSKSKISFFSYND
ncbi:hypothetical protein GW932_01790 [archaeon]|nr:hypothetical protein [archaeon]